MRYQDIRNRVWGAADYAPASSPEGEVRMREFINRGLKQLVQDAPFAFEEDIVFYLDPDILHDTGNENDIWASDPDFDPWVLRTSYTDLQEADLFARFEDLDRPLSGRWLEWVDPADPTGRAVLRTRIRDMWIAESGGGPQKRVYISLWDPVPYDSPGFTAAGVGGIARWRITMQQYALPPTVVQIENVRVFDTKGDILGFKFITSNEAVKWGYDVSYFYTPSTSRPYVVWGGSVEYLDGVNAPPLTFRAAGSAWDLGASSEPRGEFEYAYTVGFGERHDEVQDHVPLTNAIQAANAAGRRWPYLESASSPISDVIEGDTTENVSVFLHDIARTIGFGDAGTPRYQHHGLDIYLYRRRVAHGEEPAGVLYGTWPLSNAFQHIATLEAGTITFTDQGLSVPGRRLRDISSYKTLRFSPPPDHRYRVEARCVVRPEPMLDASDTCPVPEDAIDALIFAALSRCYEAAGNAAMKADATASYEKALHAMKKRNASVRRSDEPYRIRRRTRRGRYGINYPMSDGT